MSQFLFWWSQSLELEFQVSDSLWLLIDSILLLPISNSKFKYFFNEQKLLILTCHIRWEEVIIIIKERKIIIDYISNMYFVWSLSLVTKSEIGLYSKKQKNADVWLTNMQKIYCYQVFLGWRHWTQPETMYCSTILWSMYHTLNILL